MQYPYKVIVKVKRAIEWFFGSEYETKWCRSIDEVQEHLDKDKNATIFALNSSGNYTHASSIEEAIFIVDGKKAYAEYLRCEHGTDYCNTYDDSDLKW